MSGNPKQKPAEGPVPDAPEAPEPPMIKVGPPQPIIVTQQPVTDEAVRLECLKVALGQGLSLNTPSSKDALYAQVDDYFAIVKGRPFPVRENADV